MICESRRRVRASHVHHGRDISARFTLFCPYRHFTSGLVFSRSVSHTVTVNPAAVEGAAAAPDYVAVVGPGEGATTAEIARAHEVGRRLAEAGCVVVCGGLGGVMAAAADGARSAGGVSVGVLPGRDRANAANSITVAIPTGLGELRNGLLVRAADAVIAVGGSWGTLSEIALAMRTGVPVVLLGGWDVLDADGNDVPILRADTAAEAVAMVHREYEAAVNQCSDSRVKPHVSK
jgi:uncharacterized protein (TIGR00725 family)